jgi:hypothetical protein
MSPLYKRNCSIIWIRPKLNSLSFAGFIADYISRKLSKLVALNTTIRVSVLLQTSVLSGLVVAAAAAAVVGAASGAAGAATRLAGLVGVDLAVGKLAGANTLVGLAILAETVMLSGLVVRHDECEVIVFVKNGYLCYGRGCGLNG